MAISTGSPLTFSLAAAHDDYSLACGNSGFADVAFAWTATSSGTATAISRGVSTDYDTILSAFSGVDCASPAVACNDDDSTRTGGLGSAIDFPVSAGVTYYLVVAAYHDPPEPEPVQLVVDVTSAAPP